MALRGLEVFIGGNASELKRALRDADNAVKGFVASNKRELRNLEKLGAPAAIAFGGLTLAIGSAVSKFGEFEATMNRVAAVSGASASEIDALKAKAIELGAATKFSNQEAAAGMEELAKAGFNAKQTMDAIPGVLQLAAAGGVSVAQAAELAGGTLRGFGLALTDAGKVADVMAQAANQSSVDIGDLQLTMKYVAPVASSASQSLEEMTGAIAIMGNQMIKGEQAGTTLRAALTRLQKPPADAAGTLQMLGVSVQDTHGKMLPLSDILEQLREKTAKMTEVQRNAAIASIFGAEALSGMLALVKASPDDYAAMVNSMRNADGAAKKMSDTINSGLKGSLDQLGASAESASTTIGENLAPAIVAIANVIKETVDGFNALDPSLKLMATGAIAGTTALMGMVGAAGLLLPVLKNVSSVLFLSRSLALTPAGIALTVLAATVGLATMAFKAHSDAVARDTAAQAKANDERRKAADAAIRHKAELAKLVAEHDRLIDKAARSKEEEERLQAIMSEVKEISPHLANALKLVEGQHWQNAAAVHAHNAQLAEQIDLQRQALAGDVAAAEMALRAKAQRLDDQANLNRMRRETLAGQTAVPGIPSKVELRQELAGQADILENSPEAKRVAAAKQALADYDASVKSGGKTPVAKVERGAPVGSGASSGAAGRSGKDGASSAADEARRKQVQQINDLSAAYQRNLQIAQAWGGGTAAEVNGLTKLMADLKARGLDKLVEGQDAIINAQTRLNVIAGNNVMAQKAKEAADKEAMWAQIQKEMEEDSKAFWADQAAAEEKRKKDAEQAVKDAEAFKGAIGDMQGEVVALATDPSIERIANFAKGLAQDKDKLENWSKAVEKVGQAFSGAGSGADGFKAALSAVADGLNPVTVMISAAVLVVNAFKNALEGAAEAQRRLAQGMADSRTETVRAQAQLTDDPYTKATLTHNADLFDLDKEFADKLKQRREDYKKTRWSDPNAPLMTDAQVDALPLSFFSDLQQEYEAKAGVIEKNLTDALKDMAKDATDAQVKGSQDLSKAIADAGQKLEDQTSKLKDVKDELEQGGRDNWGNRISLERERDLKIQNEMQALEDKKAQALQKERDLTDEIHKINEDERKAIADIENEGIAQRAKSEAQDKAERIAKVKAEAQAKRDAKTDEINGVEAQMKKEQEATDQAISNIRILANERIAQLTDERTKLEANTRELQRQVDLMRQMASAAASNGASYQAPVNSYGQVDGSKVAIGTTAANMSGDGSTLVWDGHQWNRAATGGLVAGGVPGKDSVPMLTMPGELIVSNPLTRGLDAMVRAFQADRLVPPMPTMPAIAGAPGIGTINLTVNGARGQDVNQLADAVMQRISYQLYRSGLGRR